MYLAQQGRRRNLTRGDGNCFFRAVSHVIHGTQDSHVQVRKSLVTFVERNRDMFELFVMSGTFEDHITTMRREGAWGTQVELWAAASFYQVPFYVCSPHPTTKQYRWLLFNPLDHAQLTFEAEHTPENPALGHAELCHTCGDHFDSVITLDKLIPTSPPQLQNKTSFMSVA